MGQSDQKQGGDVFIVDNSDQDWKVRRYLHDSADLAHTLGHSPTLSERLESIVSH